MTAALADELRSGDAVLARSVSAGLAAVGGVPGIDLESVRPASSALARRIEMNWPQPASLILRLSPDFARAPLGSTARDSRRRAPALSAGPCWRSPGPPPPVGRNARRDGGPVGGESPCADWRSCGAASRRSPVWLPVLRPPVRALQPLPGAGQPGGGCAAPAWVVDVLTVAGGGEADDPDIDPTWRPVTGSGLAGTSSQDRTSIQCRPCRSIWIVFTRPCTRRCRWTFTWPMPCR